MLFGLITGRRAELTQVRRTAGETAAAKVRRVLPVKLAGRFDALLRSVAYTDRPSALTAPDTAVLLELADAVSHCRPVSIRYTNSEGLRSERVLHPYGIVARADHWYATGLGVRNDQERTFRLDRIANARTLHGSFERSEGHDPVERVLAGWARAEYQHEVTLRIHGTVGQISRHLPVGAPILDGRGAETDVGETAERWLRVGLRVQRLDWLPQQLAALDRPFVIERPDELRDLVIALAGRLTAHARRT